MKTLLSVVLAAALCTPAFAQKMGSSNTNAPSVKQSVVAGEVEISLDYTSITWASGKTMARIADKENGARMRERINNQAKDNPLGTFKTSADVKCGELALPAGEYSVFFTATSETDWNINFAAGDKVHSMKLPLMDNHEESKRLMMCLYAGEDAGAGVYVAFGKKMCLLDIKPSAAKAG